MFFLRNWFVWLSRFSLAVGTLALLAITALGQLLGTRFFLFDLISQFAVQYLLLGTLGLGWAVLHRRPVWGAINVLVISWQAVLVLPWLLADPPAATPGRPGFRVMHANVLYTRPDLSRSFALIHREQADLIVLQEMTVEQIPNAIAYFSYGYAHHDTVRSKGPSHILILSRTPFRVDPVAKKTHRVMHLTTTIRGRQVDLLTVHPRPPIFPGWYDERNSQLTFVADLFRRTRPPALLIGDFNTSPFSPHYRQWFNQEGIMACRRGFGILPTWPRFFPLAYIPIDHAFVNGGLTTTNFTVLNQSGSDHQAVRVDVQFRR